MFSSAALISIIYSLFNYNPMYSLLFFILFLSNFVINLFIQNYEFVALLVGLIYFGAILILFFFILLLINLQVVTRDNLHIKRIAFVLIPMFGVIFIFFYNIKNLGAFSCQLIKNNYLLSSIEVISLTMFNDFGVHIIFVGLILFLTLIGIVLILVSKKNINLQLKRKSI